MNTKHPINILILKCSICIGLLIGITGCNQDIDLNAYKHGQHITAQGPLYLVGNAPFSKLVIRIKNKDLALIFKSETQQNTVMKHQNKVLRVTGTLIITTVPLAQPHKTRNLYKLELDTWKIISKK